MTIHSADRMFRWVALGFIVVGIGLLLGGLFVYHNTRAFLDAAVPANAVVVEHQQTSTAKETRYISVYQFTANNDQRVTFSLRSTDGWEHPVGARVPILYDPAEPQHAMLDTYHARWMWPVILSAMGIGFSGMGIHALRIFGFIPKPRTVPQKKRKQARS